MPIKLMEPEPSELLRNEQGPYVSGTTSICLHVSVYRLLVLPAAMMGQPHLAPPEFSKEADSLFRSTLECVERLLANLVNLLIEIVCIQSVT